MKKLVFIGLILLTAITSLSAQIIINGEIVVSGLISGNLNHPQANSPIHVEVYMLIGGSEMHVTTLTGMKGTINGNSWPYAVDSYPLTEEALPNITKIIVKYAGKTHEFNPYLGEHLLNFYLDYNNQINDKYKD